MRHSVTIRDVSLVHAVVSCMGTADLRDAALAAAPEAAPEGATREDVARVAASLIVMGTGGDPSAHGLPELSREALERAAAVHRAARIDQVGDDSRELDELRAEVDRLARNAVEMERARIALQDDHEELAQRLADEQRAHDATAAERDESRGHVADLDRAVTLLEGQRHEAAARAAALQAERDELAEKLAACEASLGEVSEQLAAAQAPAAPARKPKG
jgi:predicted RNase H-like nuclease (RuvC/YqgF family)